MPRDDGASVHSHSAASKLGSSWRTCRHADHGARGRQRDDVGEREPIGAVAQRRARSVPARHISLTGSSRPKRVASENDNRSTRAPRS